MSRVGKIQIPQVGKIGFPLTVATAFVPMAIESASQPERRVEIELRRGAVSMTIAWPLSAGCEMATWMRELLR